MDKNKKSLFEDEEIEYEIIPYNEEIIEDNGYEKLPKEIFENVSFIWQSIPGQVAQKATEVAANKAAEELTKNAYRVVLKKGMHLANSKTLKGAYKGLAFWDQGNHLATHADWVPISLDGSTDCVESRFFTSTIPKMNNDK